ncbi:hypothetical protein SM007_33505 [Streptomyces avermitilis]|uniref:Uncharacterized protein n=1 Tax=Streptomyces avermitilis TaxID=33903 RepID=A0A4D4MGR4_STRAX|nr:hypothetical protein [Streptomyces avermitilis]OOV21702.1 hypothetical protein SM007_33505 [Streptomyces avermitilis]GDY68763.1 hypothetical protein SAV14893_081560 [Streptomyces avermitilis]GDY70855.1 hypothetical protein SAV31267_003400 [Streptomyces avermitilis]
MKDTNTALEQQLAARSGVTDRTRRLPRWICTELRSSTATVATDGVPWCNTDFPSILATRFIECDVRAVPVIIRTDGVPDTIAYFTFLRMIELDGQNSFNEHLTIEPAQQIPLDFAEINMKLAEHRCQDSCKPSEPGADAWTEKTWWTPGDMHSTSLTTPYRWDASVADKKYLFKPDVKIDADILPSDGRIRPFKTGYQ